MGQAVDGLTPGAGAPGRASWCANCWLQLAVGILAMVAIANLQYGWTLFVKPLDTKFHWGATRIQVAFTIFILAETWLVPFEGYFVDRFGPQPLVAVGSVLIAVAWAVNSIVATLPALYASQFVGGVGAGIVYGASIGNALKWFPTRRGLAAGLTAMAYGAGSALTVSPINDVIKHYGYQAAFLWFGLGQGALVGLCALVMRAPDAYLTFGAPPPVRQASRNYTWQDMVRTPVFWLMYFMMTIATMGGLMAIAQLDPMAEDYGVKDVSVSLLGFTGTALIVAMKLDRILNGLTRPFFGWVSDRIGRENTMFVAFALEGSAILLLVNFAHHPVLFVILTGLTFFAWGEIYSLFPALCGDLFGRKYATANYGLLYTAKGTASLLVPVGSYLKLTTGSWMPIFVVAIVFDWLAALLALFVLKPWCARWLAQDAPPPHSGEPRA